ncbi:hypothetical protein PG989_015530 [Apiospora arundinis]
MIDIIALPINPPFPPFRRSPPRPHPSLPIRHGRRRSSKRRSRDRRRAAAARPAMRHLPVLRLRRHPSIVPTATMVLISPAHRVLVEQPVVLEVHAPALHDHEPRLRDFALHAPQHDFDDLLAEPFHVGLGAPPDEAVDEGALVQGLEGFGAQELVLVVVGAAPGLLAVVVAVVLLLRGRLVLGAVFGRGRVQARRAEVLRVPRVVAVELVGRRLGEVDFVERQEEGALELLELQPQALEGVVVEQQRLVRVGEGQEHNVLVVPLAVSSASRRVVGVVVVTFGRGRSGAELVLLLLGQTALAHLVGECLALLAELLPDVAESLAHLFWSLPDGGDHVGVQGDEVQQRQGRAEGPQDEVGQLEGVVVRAAHLYMFRLLFESHFRAASPFVSLRSVIRGCGDFGMFVR